MVRMKSPPWGCPSFTPSAPISPRRPAQTGDALRVLTSMTRRPARGPATAGRLPARGRQVAPVPVGEDLLHGRAALALLQGSQRGGRVVHPVVGHEVVLPGVGLAHEVEG